jgi:hypothetical protein
MLLSVVPRSPATRLHPATAEPELPHTADRLDTDHRLVDGYRSSCYARLWSSRRGAQQGVCRDYTDWTIRHPMAAACGCSPLRIAYRHATCSRGRQRHRRDGSRWRARARWEPATRLGGADNRSCETRLASVTLEHAGYAVHGPLPPPPAGQSRTLDTRQPDIHRRWPGGRGRRIVAHTGAGTGPAHDGVRAGLARQRVQAGRGGARPQRSCNLWRGVALLCVLQTSEREEGRPFGRWRAETLRSTDLPRPDDAPAVPMHWDQHLTHQSTFPTARMRAIHWHVFCKSWISQE